MKRLSRSIRKKIRYMLDAKTVRISGVKLITDKDRIPAHLRDLIFREAYEDTEKNVLLSVLKPGMKVLEIGTGVGFIALLAASICGEKNVLTYEANPDAEELIRENFALNNLHPTMEMRAITVDGRDLTFHAAENVISSSAFAIDAKSKNVVVRSDRFMDVLNSYKPDIVIMDVEGSEYELLLGATELKANNILVELHPGIIGQDKVDEICDHLKDIGYQQGFSDRKTVHFRR
ncbi:FkbM family methyltransferase [Agrobacterium larrymoorei]|uniref:FkbM family methyltransferase n=1 Tax=Agrobacterium larrymoorei TaxID=160699 RepID=UPI0015749FFC|nr:FkbM family methyltransferase [Agrobacterium larrymoorei]NTJ42917.1 FkbM family methyltransferase [Agrobacterium larrymoorei]